MRVSVSDVIRMCFCIHIDIRTLNLKLEITDLQMNTPNDHEKMNYSMLCVYLLYIFSNRIRKF